MKKKIALFGATGRTGTKFLELALAAGYEVNALVRDAEKLRLTDSKLTVFEGDVLNGKDVDRTIAGTDIVVSLFGHVKGSPEWLQTDGTKHIIAAMKKNDVDKIISLSGGGLPFPEKDRPRLTDRLIRAIMKIIVPKILDDAVEHYKVLKNSDVKWMVVRAPRLTDGPRLGEYRVGWVGVNASSKISRSDIADFILTQLEDDTYKYQMPFVSI